MVFETEMYPGYRYQGYGGQQYPPPPPADYGYGYGGYGPKKENSPYIGCPPQPAAAPYPNQMYGYQNHQQQHGHHQNDDDLGKKRPQYGNQEVIHHDVTYTTETTQLETSKCDKGKPMVEHHEVHVHEEAKIGPAKSESNKNYGAAGGHEGGAGMKPWAGAGAGAPTHHNYGNSYPPHPFYNNNYYGPPPSKVEWIVKRLDD